MYINSFCSISPAGVLTPGVSSAALLRPEGRKAACIEPDYADLIPAMQLRRMTKPVRTGVAAAKLCLKHTGALMPDAIHAGTAYGMLQDSENFLQKMIVQEEQMLNPTAFIQSTHNTVAGQIALSLNCNAHNMTYVHKGHSFESAMLDAQLMLDDHPGYHLLAGAVEECTDTSYEILKRFGTYNDTNMAGEGAAFFSLSAGKEENSLARINAFEMFYAENETAFQRSVAAFIQRQSPDQDDWLLNGSGPAAIPHFPGLPTINYKQYCGEYPTASAFGLTLATLFLKEGQTKRCWLINSSGNYHSVWDVRNA